MVTIYSLVFLPYQSLRDFRAGVLGTVGPASVQFFQVLLTFACSEASKLRRLEARTPLRNVRSSRNLHLEAPSSGIPRRKITGVKAWRFQDGGLKGGIIGYGRGELLDLQIEGVAKGILETDRPLFPARGPGMAGCMGRRQICVTLQIYERGQEEQGSLQLSSPVAFGPSQTLSFLDFQERTQKTEVEG